MPITTCTVNGNVQNLLGAGVSTCTVKAQALTPFFHGSAFISGELVSTTTDEDGNFSIDLIETASIARKINITLDYYDGVANRKIKQYAVVIPNQASANFSDLVQAAEPGTLPDTIAAQYVTVSTISGMTATNAQSALAELQSDIDGINTLADGKIYVGNASNVAAEVTMSGDMTITNAGVAAIAAGVIVDADINGAAAITRTKLASGTASHVLVNDGSGNMSSEAQLTTGRGGTGQNFSASTGLVKVASGTMSAATLVNADVSASADIARTKLASGTASHVLINDGSGVMSSEASLNVTRGGTGAATLTANNVILGNGTSAVQFVAPGTSGNVLTSNGTTWTSATPSGSINSFVLLTAPNGYGAVNTKIRRWTTSSSNGSDLTYADSANDGMTVTVNTTGIYNISYSDQFTANIVFGVSLNSAQLTTNFQSINAADRLTVTTSGAANDVKNCSITLRLAATDVLRCHTDGTSTGAGPTVEYCRITRLS